MTLMQSFSKRLSMYVLLLTSILFVAAIMIAAVSSHKLIAEEAAKSASNMLDAVNNDIEGKLKEIEGSVRNIAWVVLDDYSEEQKLYNLTEKMIRENPSIAGCAIAFPEGFKKGEKYFSPYSYRDSQTGQIITMQLGSDDYDYYFMDWYLIPSLLKKPYWSEPYYDDGGGQQFMTTYSYPILDDRGDLIAIVTADLNLEWLSEVVASIKPYENSHMFIVGRNGSFIASYDLDSYKGNTVYSYGLSMNNEALANIGRSMVRGEKGIQQFFLMGKLSFAVYGPLENGWSAAITCQYKEVLARTSQMHMILILVAAIGMFLLFFLCYLTVRSLTSPLVEFSHAAMNIAQGNFKTTLPKIKYDDEIGKLRKSFDYMQSSLTTYIDELKTSTAANERFESELHIARNIQMNMVPTTFPTQDGLDLYAMIHPAKEVGGDLYDFFIKDGKLIFCVGDVSGKGVPASMFMAITRSAFRFIAGMDIPLNEVLYNINNAVSNGNDNGMFVTMFAGCIDLKTGHFEYCNGGHNRIVVVRPDGTSYFLDQIPNLAVGLFEEFQYKSQETDLPKGSRLVLYTDGVTEAEARDKSQFGDAALLEWAAAASGIDGAKTAAEDLLSHVKAFTGDNDQNDDITIMIINI